TCRLVPARRGYGFLLQGFRDRHDLPDPRSGREVRTRGRRWQGSQVRERGEGEVLGRWREHGEGFTRGLLAAHQVSQETWHQLRPPASAVRQRRHQWEDRFRKTRRV